MGTIQQALLAVPAAGGGGFTPSDIADMWEWWEPSREVGLVDNDHIITFNGQLNNRDWTHSGLNADTPLYRTNQLNGLAVADFSGLIWDTGPNMSALTAAHAFLVLIANSATVDSGLWSLSSASGAGTEAHFPFTGGDLYDGAFSTTRKSQGAQVLSIASWRVYEVISTSSEWTSKLDGTPQFTTASNTFGGRATPELGRSNDFSGNTVAFNGKIAGLYICSAKLSGGDRTALINYINSRFALSSS